MTAPTQAQLDTLRLHLGERIPSGGSATDTFFSDTELTGLWTASPTGGMMGAAFLGWATKAGEYARLIDMNESGAIRNFSQRFRQASTQLKIYSDLATAELALTTASGRFAGKTFNAHGCSDDERVIMYTEMFNRSPLFDGYTFSGSFGGFGGSDFVETNPSA